MPHARIVRTPSFNAHRVALLAGALTVLLLLSAVLQSAEASAKQRPLAITSPGKQAKVKGKIRLTVRASKAYKRVAFRLDGRRLWVDRKHPFKFRKKGYLKTRRLKRGKHRLMVAGRRRSGKVDRAWRVFRVQRRQQRRRGLRPPSPQAPAPPARPVQPLPFGTCTAPTNHSFESSITQAPGLRGVEAVPGRITLSDVFATPGLRSGRFELRAGDVVASGNRVEITSGTSQAFSEGTESWIRQATLISDIGFTEDGWRIVRQHHSSGGSPAIAVFVEVDPLRFHVGHGDGSRDDWTSPPISRNTWYDLTIHWRSASNNGGFVEVWFAPVGQIPQMVARTDNVTTREDHSYYKTGLYRNNSISETDVVFHDGVCMGSTQAQVGLGG
jgi:Polysaccharide lyase